MQTTPFFSLLRGNNAGRTDTVTDVKGTVKEMRACNNAHTMLRNQYINAYKQLLFFSSYSQETMKAEKTHTTTDVKLSAKKGSSQCGCHNAKESINKYV